MNNIIIISLTSYPARIKYVHKTIESLLNQSLVADKIILWLAKDEFPNQEKDLPNELLNLLNERFIIEWCENLKSFKKLIPAYEKYHNNIIVTCDDVVVYDENMLSNLYAEYIKNPKFIYCHVITRLLFDNNNKLNYLPHELLSNEGLGGNYYKDIKYPSCFNKLCGNGGVLYPPNSLHIDVLSRDFEKYCPNNDDIWFHFQALRAGYKCRVVKKHFAKLSIDPITQQTALWKINIQNNTFIKELNAIYNLYPEITKVFEIENKKNVRIINNIYNKTKKISFLKNIFSIENEYRNNVKRKIIKIFCIEIKFKTCLIDYVKNILKLSSIIGNNGQNNKLIVLDNNGNETNITWYRDKNEYEMDQNGLVVRESNLPK